MADKPKLTQDIPLPPGVVITPDYPVHEPAPAKTTASDRRVFADGSVEDKEHLSTYETAPAPKGDSTPPAKADKG